MERQTFILSDAAGLSSRDIETGCQTAVREALHNPDVRQRLTDQGIPGEALDSVGIRAAPAKQGWALETILVTITVAVAQDLAKDAAKHLFKLLVREANKWLLIKHGRKLKQHSDTPQKEDQTDAPASE